MQLKVCLVCEGSYPYVAGGVSGWVQMLITELKDIEFIVWSVATSREEMNTYRYELPPNLTEVKTLYLSDYIFAEEKGQIRLTKRDEDALRQLVGDQTEDTDWNEIFEMMKRHGRQLVRLVMSKEFFHVCVEYYKQHYPRAVFSSFLWNMRSMYFPLLSVLSGELPYADVYHSVSTGYAGVLGGVASYIRKKPFLLTEHGIYTREREEELIKADWVDGRFKDMWIQFFVKLSRIAYERADRVITLFETNKMLEIELHCPADKISIIPNGVDFESYQSLPPRDALEDHYYTVGAVVRVVPIKDIKTMLQAFAMVKEEVPNARLLILGPYDEDPEYFEECRALVEELEIEDVTFTGRVSVADYLAKFDVMVLTSISEGQPLAVLEGMAAAVPQVCTNVGSCRELLCGKSDDRLGQAGIVTPIMDVAAIARALVSLEKNPRQRAEMGEIGRKRVKRYYQKQDFLKAYADLYQEIGKGNGRNWF